MNRLCALVVLPALILLSVHGGHGVAQESQRQKRGPASTRPTDDTSGFDIEKYFSEMLDDVAVYDPASPWIYDKDQWRRRVDQMFKIRRFLDLNPFPRTEVELGDIPFGFRGCEPEKKNDRVAIGANRVHAQIAASDKVKAEEVLKSTR